MIYDCIIIGTGPAGLSAALNLQIREKNFLWLGAKNFSDKVAKAPIIANYPGLIDVSGPALANAFQAQIDAKHIEITEKMVHSILPYKHHYALMGDDAFYEAETIILATGIQQKAMLKGEQAFLGKGVSYCATCDGDLYRDKTIAVLCTNARFEQEVAYLAQLAKHVYYFPSYRPVSLQAENIQIMESKIIAIEGQQKVESIQCQNQIHLNIDGLFILRDSIALSHLLDQLEMENDHVKVDRMMATNMEGIFAAGDITGRPYQYAKAVGEGNVAAHSVIEYLTKKGKQA